MQDETKTRVTILDVQESLVEFARDRGTWPTRLDVSHETYDELRRDAECRKFLSYHTEEPFIKICGLFVYKIKEHGRYLKVS